MSEIKYGVRSITFAGSIAGAFFQQLNPEITLGAAKNQRIGNRIKYKTLSLNLNLLIVNGSATGDYFSSTARILVVQLRNEFSTVPTIADFLDTAFWSSTPNGNAVRVMMDKFVALEPSGQVENNGAERQRYVKKLRFRLRNNANFKFGSSEYPTDPTDRYYIILLSDVYGGDTNLGNWAGDCFVRLSYTDV